MVGAQLGYDSPAMGAFRFDVSAAYYDYTLGSVVGGDAGDFRTNLRNPDGSYVSDFDLGDVIVGATWNGAGDRWPIRLTADYVYNFGAETSQDTGYGMDLAFRVLGELLEEAVVMPAYAGIHLRPDGFPLARE